MDFFEEFFAITGKELPNPENLTTVEKAALAQQIKNQGESVRSIATYFKCHVSYVYKLLNEAKKDRMMELECQTYKDHFLEIVYELESDIEMYKKVQSGLRDGYMAEEVTENGDVVEYKKTGSIRDFKDVGSLVFTLQKELIRLKAYVGIIPGEASADIYQTLQDLDPKHFKEEVGLREQNSQQIQETLMKKLSQRKPTIKENALKAKQDETIL